VIPAADDLYLTGDWTVEAWFKDEDASGGGNFNHEVRYIVAKDGEKEAPFRLGVKTQACGGTSPIGPRRT